MMASGHFFSDVVTFPKAARHILFAHDFISVCLQGSCAPLFDDPDSHRPQSWASVLCCCCWPYPLAWLQQLIVLWVHNKTLEGPCLSFLFLLTHLDVSPYTYQARNTRASCMSSERWSNTCWLYAPMISNIRRVPVWCLHSSCTSGCCSSSSTWFRTCFRRVFALLLYLYYSQASGYVIFYKILSHLHVMAWLMKVWSIW